MVKGPGKHKTGSKLSSINKRSLSSFDKYARDDQR